jgi:glucoamylase
MVGAPTTNAGPCHNAPDLAAGPALVHWSFDGWRAVHDTETVDTGLGLHAPDVPTAHLTCGTSIVFTFYWRQQQGWEGVDFTVDVQNA